MAYYRDRCTNILVVPTVATIQAFSPLPPRPTRNLGVTIPSYKMTSPSLLRRHNVSAQYGTDRDFRMRQQSERWPIHSDNVPFPVSHMNPSAHPGLPDFESLIQANPDERRKRITREDIKSGEATIEDVEIQIANNARKRNDVVYLTPWDYQAKIWEVMGIRRGTKKQVESNPFSSMVVRSHHLTYEHYFSSSNEFSRDMYT